MDTHLEKSLCGMRAVCSRNPNAASGNSGIARALAATQNSSTSCKLLPRHRQPPQPARRTTDNRVIGRTTGSYQARTEPSARTRSRFCEHHLDACLVCGGACAKTPTLQGRPKVVSRALPHRRATHQSEYWCDHCRSRCWAPMPPTSKGRPCRRRPHRLDRLHEGRLHASFSTIRLFLTTSSRYISRSQWSDTIAKVTRHLDGPYEELLKLLPMKPSQRR